MEVQAKKSLIYRSFVTGALSLLVALVVHTGTSYADTACDPQFMDAIDARGFTEAARENAQNENLIFKPDSVLEYSCFKENAPITTATATLLFRSWSLEDPTTDPLFVGDKTVYPPSGGFIGQNFGHDYLNNRYADPGSESSGFCEIMHKIFKAARCMNFYNRIDTDTMHDLTWYTSNDPRREPTSCINLPYAGINMAVDMAYNNRTPAWTQGPYLRDSTDYIADPAKIMDQMFKPGECGTAIPTGMVVTDYNAPIESFLEKTCANPACVYMPADYSTGECQMP